MRTLTNRPHIKKLRALAVDPDVDVWAMDEVHFQQHGSRCRMWVPPEVKDPVVLHHPTRKKVGYFGAVRLRDGKFLAVRETDRFDAASAWSFLRRLRGISGRAGRRVELICDNAKYHHANLHAKWRDRQEPAFHIAFLPPYSPELNPIERVWKLVRRQCLHNEYFPTVDAICEPVEALFDSWSQGSSVLKKLCNLA
jgi:transposase